MVYTFVAAIPKQDNQSNDWQHWLRQDLAVSQLFLTNDEQILHADELIGFFRLIELEEANTLFQQASWFTLAEECPWFSGTAGFFNWTHTVSELAAKNHLLPKLVELGCPVSARTDNGHFKQAIGLVEFDLTNILSKFGFEDGDALLSRDEGYLIYVYKEITQCLDRAGLEGHVAILETAHNPLMLSEDLLQDGEKVDDDALKLATFSVRIWAHDWNILKDAEFWQD